MTTIEYNKYLQQMEEWQAYYYYTSFHFRVRKIVRRANWNKNIITKFELTNHDKEMHRLRFERLIEELEEINQNWKDLNYCYDKNRINKIKNQLNKIKDYEFKNSKY